MACSYTIQGIADNCGLGNKGGIKKVYLSPYVDDIFTVTQDSITAVKSGSKWHEFAFAKNTANLTQTLNVDEANGINFVSSELVMQFNRQQTEKRIAISALALAKVAGIVVDANGNAWALGMEDGASATAGSGQTGAAKTDGNFYSITLGADSETFLLSVDKSVVEGLDIEA